MILVILVMSRIARHGSLEKAVSAFPAVSLTLANGDTCAVKGRVESLSGVVDSSTGSVSARAVFPNADGLLLSGSTGSIVIPNEMKQVIVIPQSATYEIQDKTYAWRVVNGQAESTIITVLPTTDGKSYVVTSGLAVGDVIVAKGAGYVKTLHGYARAALGSRWYVAAPLRGRSLQCRCRHPHRPPRPTAGPAIRPARRLILPADAIVQLS